MSPQALTLVTCLAFTLFYNGRFWSSALGAQPVTTLADWARLLSNGVLMTALQCVVVVPWVNRLSVRPLLSILLLLMAAAISYFTGHYGTYFDTHMIDDVD